MLGFDGMLAKSLTRQSIDQQPMKLLGVGGVSLWVLPDREMLSLLDFLSRPPRGK